MKRTKWYCPGLESRPNSEEDPSGHLDARRPATGEKPNLVSSLLEDGRHAPALDIDIPCVLRQSTTPGHHHLLIDLPMSWRQYRRLLRALSRAGVIERNYYCHSLKRKQTFLRLPGVPKAVRQR